MSTGNPGGRPETTRPWKPYAKYLILPAFSNENAMNTGRRLLMAEKVTVDPAIRQKQGTRRALKACQGAFKSLHTCIPVLKQSFTFQILTKR